MRRAIFLSIALCVCRKPISTPPDAALSLAPDASAAQGKLVLTREKLDGYVTYQQAMLEKSTRAPLDRAKREENARAASGLNDDELRIIDEMVSSVVARRMVSKLTLSQPFVPDPKMMDALSPEQKKRLEEATAAFKTAQAAALDLTDERKRYGSANIDLLLTREAELIKNWSALMGMSPP